MPDTGRWAQLWMQEENEECSEGNCDFRSTIGAGLVSVVSRRERDRKMGFAVLQVGILLVGVSERAKERTIVDWGVQLDRKDEWREFTHLFLTVGIDDLALSLGFGSGCRQQRLLQRSLRI